MSEGVYVGRDIIAGPALGAAPVALHTLRFSAPNSPT